MLEHENTATSSTQTYILKCSRLFQILNSEDPIKVIEDPRIKELEDINNWFKIRKGYNGIPLHVMEQPPIFFALAYRVSDAYIYQ
jgi:hypothetical protein